MDAPETIARNTASSSQGPLRPALKIQRTALPEIHLGEALQNGWIEFWYQPKIDLRKMQLSGAETFARARHPLHGLLPPGTFMPGADDDSLVLLAERAFVNALEASATFSKLLGFSFPIDINVHAAALQALPLPQIISDNWTKSGNAPDITFEVTEGQIVASQTSIRPLLAKLQPAGVRLTIDDCIGRLSVTQLKELPISEIKIAQTRVAGCGDDSEKADTCQKVSDLAHEAGIESVAVGIESEADLRAVFRMGCDQAQGFLFSAPLSQHQFIALLRDRASVHKRQSADKQGKTAKSAQPTSRSRLTT